MKSTFLFKTLVDFLYMFHFFFLLAILITPFTDIFSNDPATNIQSFTFLRWSMILFSAIAYIVFLRGLYFVRKMARIFLSNKFFTDEVIGYLKKSGIHFTFTGALFLLSLFVSFLNNLQMGKLQLGYDIDLMSAMYLLIIGMFFMLQSRAIQMAKSYKEENELTV